MWQLRRGEAAGIWPLRRGEAAGISSLRLLRLLLRRRRLSDCLRNLNIFSALLGPIDVASLFVQREYLIG